MCSGVQCEYNIVKTTTNQPRERERRLITKRIKSLDYYSPVRYLLAFGCWGFKARARDSERESSQRIPVQSTFAQWKHFRFFNPVHFHFIRRVELLEKKKVCFFFCGSRRVAAREARERVAENARV